MIEVLKEFLLFGVVELFIILCFYKNIWGIKTIKYKHGFILVFGYFLFGVLSFPFIKQMGMILMFFVYLSVINKRICKLYFVCSVFALFYLLCIEAVVCLIYDLILKVEVSSLDNYYRFLYVLPIRLVEALIPILYKKYIGDLKIWDGHGGVK